MKFLLSRAVAPGKSFELAKAYYAGWLHTPYKPATVPFVDDAVTWSTYELAEQASKEVPAGESCVWIVVPEKPVTQVHSTGLEPLLPLPSFKKD